jgi:hypothetical protein
MGVHMLQRLRLDLRRASVAFNSTLKDCYHLDEQTRDCRTKQRIKKYIIQKVVEKYTQFLLIVEKKLLRLVLINQDSRPNTNQSGKDRGKPRNETKGNNSPSPDHQNQDYAHT